MRDDDDAYLDTDEDEEEDRGSDEEYGAREEDDELGAAAGDHDAVRDMGATIIDSSRAMRVCCPWHVMTRTGGHGSCCI